MKRQQDPPYGPFENLVACYAAMDDIILECRHAHRGKFDDADRVYWVVRRAQEDLLSGVVTADVLLYEVINGVESLGLGRLEKWKDGAPALSRFYEICSAWLNQRA